jgi:putative exosortase-associated protein (TIGR04073 family)
MRILLPLLVAIPLLLPAPASAYGPADKLGRGIANIVTGILVLPGSIARETEEDGAEGIPAGIGLGLGRTVARELVGVYEVVTFPIPVPHDYAPILEPPYPWQYFGD